VDCSKGKGNACYWYMTLKAAKSVEQSFGSGVEIEDEARVS